jgi:cell division septation protein DedD
MVVGFNHNFSYRGVVYHVQTEDGGRNSPTIVTLLYCGGTILASRKTSYADITRVDNLPQVVEELMKEQHKGMLRGLKNGEFDDAIARFEGSAGKSRAPAAPAESPPSAPPPQAQVQKPAPAPVEPAGTAPAGEGVSRPAPEASPSRPPVAAGEASLDEIILSYLLGEGK